MPYRENKDADYTVGNHQNDELNLENFDLSLNFGDSLTDIPEKPFVNTFEKEPIRNNHNSKKIGLFDKSRISKKEENTDYSNKYEFKSYVNGEDELTKKIIERQREIRQSNNILPLETSRVLNLEILMSAPKDYFKKYSTDVDKGVEYVRRKIAENDLASFISTANANPTDMKLQNEAYVAISRYISEFTKTTEHRDAHLAIIINMIVNEILGFDVIDPLWHSKKVTEIVCNGPFDIQVEIDGEMEKVDSISFRNRDHLSELLERLFRSVGKTLAQSTPQVKGRLHDKSRIFATHHSISPDGPNFNVRRHPEGFWTPDALIDRGAADKEVMTYLGNLIHKGASFIIAGGTSTGKMLTLDTKLRTPQGYTLMGDIKIGDKIIDHHGKNGNVTDIFKHEPQQVYAIKFANNETIYGGLEHNWFVKDKREPHKEYQVLTTEELIQRGAHANSENMFATPFLSKAITYENEKTIEELPIEPYEFGINLFNNNIVTEIPNDYKTSTIESRTLLVLGVIHGFKTINSTSRNTIIVNNEKLATDIIEIVSSLGYIILREDNNEDNNIKLVIEESFPDKTKVGNVPNVDKELDIVDIYPVDGRVEEMWCITVDTVDSTYLVGDSFITTHNTTMLNALTGFYPANARILTLEDNLEMKPNPKKYLAAALETRPPSPDKPNDRGITMRDLVWGAMQMRPEVLIIGEVTDDAAYDLCQALNTGHAGASTFHANSSQLAITRVASLVAQSGLTTIDGAFDLIAAAFDFVINLRHFPQDGSRKIFSIDEVGTEIITHNGKPTLKTEQLWKFESHGLHDGKMTGSWRQVGDISAERKERRMFDSQETLTWEQLQELSSIPDEFKTA